jgi:predicted secreted protein
MHSRRGDEAVIWREAMRFIILIGLSLTLCTGVWAAEGKKAPALQQVPDTRVTIVRGKPNPGNVTVAVEETFRIELPFKASTDYEWAVTRMDPEMIAVGPRMLRTEVDAGGLVKGGTYAFPVKCLKPGKTMVVLEYRQSEEKVPAVKTFTVNITVTPKS